MALDLAPLWDFARPAVSEQRFLAALGDAAGDDRLVLRTQVARTHGLRRDFARALALLDEMAPEVARAGPEARVRHALERGRCRVSAAHPRDTVTPAGRDRARADYEAAAALARQAGLDALAVDALHMLALVDGDPAGQLRHNREALSIAATSTQPDARRWEAPLRNNIGLALHSLGRFDEALDEFRQAVVLREAQSNPGATRIAWWMVAWTLRAKGDHAEALAVQQRLAREGDEAGEPDPHVYAELAQLHRALGDTGAADAADARRQALATR
ncbi:MAG: tetratricopeptide repeat protein [Rhizobacter sp.]